MSASARVTDEAEAGDRPQRRKHSIAEKRHIVEATLLVAGASAARVGREHGVNANQVWVGGGSTNAGYWVATRR